jgi:YHS domain-containing protein
MIKIGMVAVFAALLLMTAGAVWAQQGKAQTVCPVLQGNIDKSVYVDYKGKRIYFCCKGCDAEFNKDPEKYLKKLGAGGITPENSPAAGGKGGK